MKGFDLNRQGKEDNRLLGLLLALGAGWWLWNIKATAAALTPTLEVKAPGVQIPTPPVPTPPEEEEAYAVFITDDDRRITIPVQDGGILGMVMLPPSMEPLSLLGE